MKARLVLAGALLVLGLTAAALLPHLLVEASPTSNHGYRLDWFTVDGGGSTAGGGQGYSLAGTVGQADAGLLSGGGYALYGGFWAGGDPSAQPGLDFNAFLPLIKQD
jgi:hypothetical protein